MPIISKEHFNKWYSLKSYYVAKTLADIPVQVSTNQPYLISATFMLFS